MHWAFRRHDGAFKSGKLQAWVYSLIYGSDNKLVHRPVHVHKQISVNYVMNLNETGKEVHNSLHVQC